MSVPATYKEPKGLFLLEAMACGIPVVQPRRGAFTEVLERTGGGLLVEPDSVESLAQGIISVANDKQLAETLSERGYENVRKQYSVARMADKALEVYESL
jgi:glycosyltransferase involved in cell wall biosynthesis